MLEYSQQIFREFLMQHHLSERGKRILSIISILIFIAFSVAIFFCVGRPLIRFASEPEHFRAWIDSLGSWGALAFIGIMTLQIVVAIIPGEPLEIGAGYAFGAMEGIILCQISVAIGTALVFWFVRYFGTKALEVFFPLEKINSLRFLSNNKRLYLLTGILFFIPGTPKDLITYFMGLTRIKLLPLLALSVFCRLPSIITSTISGNALGQAQYKLAAIVIAGTIIISIAGIIIYRHISKKETEAKKLAESAGSTGEIDISPKLAAAVTSDSTAESAPEAAAE